MLYQGWEDSPTDIMGSLVIASSNAGVFAQLLRHCEEA